MALRAWAVALAVLSAAVAVHAGPGTNYTVYHQWSSNGCTGTLQVVVFTAAVCVADAGSCTGSTFVSCSEDVVPPDGTWLVGSQYASTDCGGDITSVQYARNNTCAQVDTGVYGLVLVSSDYRSLFYNYSTDPTCASGLLETGTTPMFTCYGATMQGFYHYASISGGIETVLTPTNYSASYYWTGAACGSSLVGATFAPAQCTVGAGPCTGNVSTACVASIEAPQGTWFVNDAYVVPGCSGPVVLSSFALNATCITLAPDLSTVTFVNSTSYFNSFYDRSACTGSVIANSSYPLVSCHGAVGLAKARYATTPLPTTPAPTTAAPTTHAPTTAAPTTASPTTAAPTTAGPTTPAPSTPSPTTPAPTASPAPGASIPPMEIGVIVTSTIAGALLVAVLLLIRRRARGQKAQGYDYYPMQTVRDD